MGEHDASLNGEEKPRPFLCGVVEGFYGRPWTLSQRKDLFEKMQSWGMTSYLYAPKDDCKHRAFWRELYTVEEAEHLQSLITAAHESNVDFYYAISPGLDITYSNSKEMSTLKRKLDQVAQLGCRSFSLLFDDIEAEMSKPDKEAFQSFAHAQVSVTNEIYQHLGQPNFLFCPTQYCTARAVPTIATSEYLKTIGAKLPPDINIMWTGDKVIPKEITVASLETITQVLKRPPVIWDNEHANDYDQKRLYLGPYSGRSPEIIPKLRGVLTNPNCEYGANFVAIHSLAAWAKCTVDGCSSLDVNDTVTSDIKLELSGSSGGTAGGPGCEDGAGGSGSSATDDIILPPPQQKLPPHVYHPRAALQSAIAEWMADFSRPRHMWGPITKPQVGLNPTGILQPIVNTCMTATATMSSAAGSPQPSVVNSSGNGGPLSPKSSSQQLPPMTVPTVQQQQQQQSQFIPTSFVTVAAPGLPCAPLVPMMNSLVSSNQVVLERQGGLDTVSSSSPVSGGGENKTVLLPEPMETNLETDGSVASDGNHTVGSPVGKVGGGGDVLMESTTSPPTPASVMQVEGSEGVGQGLTKAESTTMLCEPPTSPHHLLNGREEEEEHSAVEVEEDDSGSLSLQDIEILCDLFYLPCEHGPKAIELLTEFYWLKTNAGCCLLDRKLEEEAAVATAAAAATDDEAVVAAAGGLGNDCQVSRPEWDRRREHFVQLVEDIKRAFDRLCQAANRELVYNLFTYVWDTVGVAYLLLSYINWLSLGQFSPKYKQLIIGRHTWFSGIREAFQSGDHEPWVFRGGLTADLQRLMPVDSGNDLFMYQYPDHPTNNIYKIRSYEAKDEEACYRIAVQTWDDGMDATDFYSTHPRLIGDKSVGPFLNFYPSLCFVFENTFGEVVGYMLAAPNLKEFQQRVSIAWQPELRCKYPRTVEEQGEGGELLTPCEATINSLHTTEAELPPGLEAPETWALMRIAILASVTDYSLARRSTMLMLACLRTTGVLKVLSEVPKKEKLVQDMYARLGFSSLAESPTDTSGEILYLCRKY